LGDGMVDLPAVQAALAAAGYDGWVVVEQDSRLLTPAQRTLPRLQAQRSRATLRGLGL
jgi:sugar phosphate isomerase/epimerase